VDIHEENLTFCRRRFGDRPNLEIYKNNGFDFHPVADASLTSIFCYDAMVHFSPDLVASYLKDAARVLRPGGMALFHHSNYAAPLDLPYGLNPHARNHMTELLFREYALKAGLDVVETKAMEWGGEPGLDRLSLLRRSL
jgi:SAM-dependent methyltransferase